MSNERITPVRQLYDAFRRSDIDRVAQLISDTEWHEAEGMPYAGHYKGAAEVFENVFQRIAKDVDGFSAQTDELMLAGDDRVLVLGHYTGTGANGPLKAAFAHVWTVEDGKIARFVQYADTHIYRRAVPSCD